MLSQGVGYAATALGRIAAAGGTSVLIKDIADDCDIPSAYLAKIINTLARRGIVTTQRGVGGGVVLARAAQSITLFDLCVALDDLIVQPRCMLGVAPCSDERACPAHQFWTGHRAGIVAFLQSTTIADIAAFETRRRWKHLPATPNPSDPPGAPPGRPLTVLGSRTPMHASDADTPQ
ncbi:MAG: Rrf2 family transcriptional regulator [Phycisphaerae bacterium]